MRKVARYWDSPLAQLAVLVISFAACGCSSRGQAAGESEPAEAAPASLILLDDHVLVAGREVNSRDLQYRIEDLRHRLATGNPDDPKRPRMEATIAFIESARNANPQCLRFRTVLERGHARLEPLDRFDFAQPSQELAVDVAVIGGEIESVTTAMAFARRGKSVALLYVAPLGGLCSDDGGNLRFFDGYGDIPRPEEQRDLFRKAFQMGDFVSLPTRIDQRIANFLRSEFHGRIRLIEMNRYESLRINRVGDRIESVDIPNATRIVAAAFIDSDPESRLAEKAGLSFDALTPNLPYGLVFDVPGLSRRHFVSLFRNPRLLPEAIAKFAGVSLESAQSDPAVRSALEQLSKDLASDFARDRGNYWLGFKAVATGFDLYMKLKGTMDDSPGLAFLNRARRTSGFNISINSGAGNFNSISYSFGFTLLQHSHSISNDERLRLFHEVEIPALTEYLAYVTDDEAIRVRVPDQFYVRKSTAHFKSKNPYTRDDFKKSKPEAARWWMMYPMDYRSISPRNAREKQQFNRLFWSGTEVFWICRPDVCLTEISNLYLLNKCMLTPEFSGATRILQNLINTGVALAERLSR